MYYKTTLEVGKKGMGLGEAEILLYQIWRVSAKYGVNIDVGYQNEKIHSDRGRNGSTNPPFPTFDEILKVTAIEHQPRSRLAISIGGIGIDESICKTSLSDLLENCKVGPLSDDKEGSYEFLKEIKSL